jgi:hypothetical protein
VEGFRSRRENSHSGDSLTPAGPSKLPDEEQLVASDEPHQDDAHRGEQQADAPISEKQVDRFGVHGHRVKQGLGHPAVRHTVNGSRRRFARLQNAVGGRRSLRVIVFLLTNAVGEREVFGQVYTAFARSKGTSFPGLVTPVNHFPFVTIPSAVVREAESARALQRDQWSFGGTSFLTCARRGFETRHVVRNLFPTSITNPVSACASPESRRRSAGTALTKCLQRQRGGHHHARRTTR